MFFHFRVRIGNLNLNNPFQICDVYSYKRESESRKNNNGPSIGSTSNLKSDLSSINLIHKLLLVSSSHEFHLIQESSHVGNNKRRLNALNCCSNLYDSNGK